VKKKGFTLIELLAVIVILAIIALIATPIILSMINNARKSAAKSSAYGYIEAIDSNNGFADADVAGYTKITDGTHDVSEISVPMKGKAPDSGSVEIEKGKVKTANICINGYTVKYEERDVKVIGGCSDVPSEPISDNTDEENIPNPVSFSTDSWETIAANTTSDKYHVGDIKEIKLDLEGNGTDK